MPDKKYFIKTDDSPKLELAPGIETFLMTGFHGEKMMIVQHNIQPGSEAPLHSHPHEQVGVILEGRGRLTIDGESRFVERGDYYYMPGGVKHGVVNIDDAMLKMVEVFHPVREDLLEKAK